MKSFTYKTLEELPVKKFDVIISIEAFEHIPNPAETISRLVEFLDDDGFIFLTTALSNRSMSNLRYFPYWIYQQDRTHIGFFHERTFEWLAAKLNLDLFVAHYDLIVLHKSFNRIITTSDGKLVFCAQDEWDVKFRHKLF